MKRILHDTINDKPYLGVEVDETMLRLVLLQHQKNWTVFIDKRVIPQLIQFLQDELCSLSEAEEFAKKRNYNYGEK